MARPICLTLLIDSVRPAASRTLDTAGTNRATKMATTPTPTQHVPSPTTISTIMPMPMPAPAALAVSLPPSRRRCGRPSSSPSSSSSRLERAPFFDFAFSGVVTAVGSDFGCEESADLMAAASSAAGAVAFALQVGHWMVLPACSSLTCNLDWHSGHSNVIMSHRPLREDGAESRGVIGKREWRAEHRKPLGSPRNYGTCTTSPPAGVDIAPSDSPDSV